jgi:hypothetical protein
LGYSFLFRNYRADVGKWTTSDPLGYPDGWNNLAYVNNWVTMAFDWLGAEFRTDAIGFDPLNPQWGTEINTDLDYLSTGTTRLECNYGDGTWTGTLKDMIDQMKASSHVIEINEIDSLDSDGAANWPNTSSQNVDGGADIYIDNISYTDAFPLDDLGADGIPDDFSFSDGLLWELMNAFARTELGSSEAQFTRPNFLKFRNTLDRTKDPFPFKTSPRLYKDPSGRYVVE